MKLDRFSDFESIGTSVEKGEILDHDQEVFKKYWIAYGKNVNEIVIDEYEIKTPDGRPDSPSRLVGNIRYYFSEDDIDRVEVTDYYV